MRRRICLAKHPVRWAMVRHLAGTVLLLAVMGGVVLWQGHRVATHQAEDAAAADVRTAALALVVPLTARELASTALDGREALETLDETTAPQLETGDLDAVHLWRLRPDGSAEIVWSTRPSALGTVETVDNPVPLFGTTDVAINQVGSGDYPGRSILAPLYEAYAGFADRTGTPYVLEVYKPVQRYPVIRSRLLADWLPISLGGVAVLGLATLPLSVVLARRMVAVDRERRHLAQVALDAAANEHRRIAEQLHERTVQDLAAVTLLLGALGEERLDDRARHLLERIEQIVATDVHQLRLLLQDAVQDDEHGDLATAVRAWVAHVGLDPAAVMVDVPPHLELTDPTVALAHRVAKEALRNVAKHAEAEHTRVAVTRDGRGLTLTVSDDGRGFEEGDGGTPGSGLRLVRAAVRAWGGTVDVDSTPGHGTTVTASWVS